MAIKFLNGQSIAGNLTLLGTIGNPKLIFSSASYDNAIIETGTTYAMNIDMQDAIYQLMSNSAKTQYAITGSLSTVDVVLNYGGSNKLRTTNTGVTVSGVVSATGVAASGVVSAPGGNSTQWNSAYAKTNAFTTIGTNFTKIPNVSAVSYTRINANETISLLSASQFRSAIGAGTSSSSGVTSISADTAGNRLGIAVKDGSTSTPEIGLNINGLATKGSPQNWDISSITLLAFDGDETDDNVQIEIADLLTLSGTVTGSGVNNRLAIWNGTTAIDSDSDFFTTGTRLVGTQLAAGDGTDGYFYSDTNGRTAFAGGDFYIQTSVNSYYNYATQIYLGNTSGDNVYIRGNPISGNSWDINTSGRFTGTSVVLEAGGSTYLSIGSYSGNPYINTGTSGGTVNIGAPVSNTTNLQVQGTVRATGGYKSADGTAGITGTFTIVDKYSATRTLTIKNGLITAKN